MKKRKINFKVLSLLMVALSIPLLIGVGSNNKVYAADWLDSTEQRNDTFALSNFATLYEYDSSLDSQSPNWVMNSNEYTYSYDNIGAGYYIYELDFTGYNFSSFYVDWQNLESADTQGAVHLPFISITADYNYFHTYWLNYYGGTLIPFIDTTHTYFTYDYDKNVGNGTYSLSGVNWSNTIYISFIIIGDYDTNMYSEGLISINAFLNRSYVSIRSVNQVINDNFNDNSNYQDGYNKGFQNGQSHGYNQGYDDGLNQGYLEGYGVGKSNGIDEGISIGVQMGNENGYQVGYDDGYNDGLLYGNDLNIGLIGFMPGILGAVFAFFFQISSISFLGISLLDIFALLFSLFVLGLVFKFIF